jgi:pimeloyl-ACP methyl ester carboxylesterase
MFTRATTPMAQFQQELPTLPVGTLERRYEDLECGRVAYLRHGEGPPLLLVHGIPTSCRLWEPLLGLLGQHYDCIVPDLLALGRSMPAADADVASPGQAGMLAQLLDRLGVNECFAVFHDQGGAHGMQFLTMHGARVRAVAFTNVVCYDNWPVPVIALTASLGRMGLLPALARLRLPQLMLGAYSLPRTISRGRFPASMREDWFHALDQGGEPLAAWVRYVVSQDARWTRNAVPMLQGWHKPARVIWAADDHYLPVSWGARLAAEIPGADDQPVLLPFAGHFWQAEVPVTGARALMAFFDPLR